MSFGEYSLPTDTLAAILGAYPFSVGLLRELLQNTDDSGASKQIFVLDAQSHGTSSLVDAKLGTTQGPSLLAYNNALFSDEDWDALQSIHRSSKKTDTSKIGKYGIGFRSCYHVTDNPHIISGEWLAILDPHHNFTHSGGTKFQFPPKALECADQLDAFDFFLPPNARSQPFPGTIIRLPLRKPGAQSSISSKSVDVTEIRQLFEDFVREEIGISLLFLKNVRSVELHEIDAQGNRRCIASSSIQKTPVTSWNVDADRHTTFKCTVSVENPLVGRVEKTWRIAHSYFVDSASTSLLALRLGQDPRPVLAKHKLLSEMAIAIPMSILTNQETSGRLFTYLPLPLKTGFPGHVHGLFALTQSRQNLNNGGEIGIVRGSEDSVLVEWNHILFQSFLPRTWMALLTVLLQDDHLTDVFRAWPPAQSVVFGGDNAYWQMLPEKLLSCIVQSKAEVWPVITGSKPGAFPHFANLESLYVASSDVDAATLRALANAGLRITQLPEYILQLLKEDGQPFKLLSPDAAYLDLSKRIGNIHSLDGGDRATLLNFLLKTQKLDNISGLPILPLVNGEYLAPTKCDVNAPTHTMLDQAECTVFKGLDDSAISLPSIASHLHDLFRHTGPTVFNVAVLTPEKVASYLTTSPLGVDLSGRKLDDVIISWLIAFWEWLGTWSARDHLFPLISSLCVIPTCSGVEAPEIGVFSELGVDQSLVSIFKQLGLAFLHPAFSPTARTALGYYPLVLKDLTDTHLVLDRLQLGRIETGDAHVLSKHVFDCVLQSSGQRPLDEGQRSKLRSLPIFPLLTPVVPPMQEKSSIKSPSLLSSFKLPSLHKKSKSVSVPTLGRIPDGATVLGIPSGNTVLLPIVEYVAYLDGSNAHLNLLPHLAPSNDVPLTNIDILTLAVQHFSGQPKSLQCAFLDYMVQHRDSLPPSLLNSLREVPFIPVQDGRLQSPKQVIDPTKTELVAIYSESKDRIPTTFFDDMFVLRHLRSLGLLPDSLTVDMVAEQIRFISSGSTSSQLTLAIQLLSMVNNSGLDCTSLPIPSEAKWLPTNRGLVGRGGCFDISKKPELFDEVLPVLDGKATISPTLRVALGWDQPISMSILQDQLRAVLRSGQAQTLKLDRLIKEFSSRPLIDAEVAELVQITLGQAWIPISSGRVVATKYATFSSTLGLPGFHQIPFTLADQADVRSFLLRMGCTDRPSSTVLMNELKSLEPKLHKQDVVDQTLAILAVVAEDLKAVDRKDILVPDSNGVLRQVAQVYFNDIGERACLVDPGKYYIAHPKLSDEMSKRLLMYRLGFQAVELSPGIDMGETLTTTIRNVLKQYSEQQICNEFIANACDAGATKFGILVDESHGPVGKLLSNAMTPFQNCASLVFYNSGVFTAKDFEGICRTGIGGKEQRPTTIGQFGLGVLSMFHFTELAMIVSGASVLFLDPSKTHLPIQGRASLLLPLEQIKRWYPDHLQCLDGLFDFHMKPGGHYNGTLFRLPLRNPSHINPNSILNTGRVTAQYVRDKIVKPYWNSAKHALIFTKLESIVTLRRDSSGRTSHGWSISASRDNPQTIVNYRSQLVHVNIDGADSPSQSTSEDFKVVTVSTALSNLPAELKPLIEPHRLRSTILVCLAAPLSPSNANHHLFSTLPLPMTTTLPVHLSASFILAPDRRHVRLDDSGDSESKYNGWLLSNIAPVAYLFLLEDLLRTQNGLGNEAWWPGNTSQQQDAVSRHLVDSFYSTHLGSTKRRVFASVFEPGQQFKPSDVLLGGSEPMSVRKVLALINTPHVARLPPNVRERCTSAMKVVDPAFVKSELKSKARSLASLYSNGQVTLQDIQIVTDYLVEDSSSCIGLPLVPLVNGKLAILQESGSNTYYVWRPTNPDRPLFRPEFLVHADFKPHGLLTKGLNVMKVSSTAIDGLIKEHFSEADHKTGMKPDDERWVETFWAEYPHFGIPKDSQFTTYPLVRTTRAGQYVCLKSCWSKNVILTGKTEPYWLGPLLSDLGAYVVHREGRDLPKSLREALQIYPAFTFEKVLEFLNTIGTSSIAGRFSKLDPASHTLFADWARGHIARTPERLLPIASALPIWKKLQKEQVVTLHSATELKMLPFGIGRDLAMRFMGVPSVEHNVSLMHLKVVPMDFNQFWGNLKLPTTLKPEDQQAYKQLLALLPSNFTFGHDNNILVPNGNLKLVKVNTLYARHALFVAAFGSDSAPERFIWDSYRDLEVRLVALGLKSHTNLDIDTFKLCARAIQDDTAHPNIVARARIVFRAYGDDMPMLIQSHQQDIWRQLDQLRFVPRQPLRRRTMGIQEDSVYVKHLPNIVSPDQVLLIENEAIAWTQRAVLLYPPEGRVLVANPTFGEPTPREVVEHLRVLALQVAKDYTSDVYVQQDLEATYRWLDDRQDVVEEILIEFHDEPLFLNVNDPRTDPWLWHCADEMFFNIVDGGDLKSVKKFLMPFKDLLSVAGVENIKHAPVPGVERSTTESQLTLLRQGFQTMRAEAKLTDVVFVADDDMRYPAHRAFLAPMSEYLNDLFCGSFTESGPGTAEEPIEIELDYPGSCVDCILDFMYIGKAPDLERLSDLLDLMDLSNYWGLTELNQLVQTKIIGNNQISPATFEEVLERATTLDAQLLLTACEFFERENRDAIMRLKGELTGKRRAAKRLPKKTPAARVSVLSTSSTTSSSKPPMPKKVIKGLMKGLRKVGDSFDFMS
ncbi:hypothetical protein FB45DRAFT_900138 [Roridomyces roridus]|uniref:BTB domain-containing protein n=1 Tax=Roridomyces roridus TaxID=1738132 RepID=A0AAD7C7T3_9AGAR|nr:hypothetical protein FB45DRAFT_900138 [Roridomyces roridus]